ncbi:efflux RND transporter permease subunit [Zavarzinia compransoris]|uniref:Multidrug transporter AcrB n=1 Tax=Zavarzinia compransoris TaxID=1264899 RepID=A0A317DZ26_9PROT|nr:efflux RND transporter permease subunit [Zavarzinia compransoris]PWR20037.1 multidrug transporter AcrB [Zavarzinia compransoris]TDP44842.1 multidrug efflux pump [Zavarzinia compransoris]
MSLPEICIRRPVFATVLSLVICLVGLVAYQRLAVREYPNIDVPVVSVRTDLVGASAAVVENQITQVLEDSISGLDGIDTITSSSRDGRSAITVRFVLGVSPDVAASDVRDRVSRVRRQLPDEATEPQISKVEDDAQPIIYLSTNAEGATRLEVTEVADTYVVDRLQTIPGVSSVELRGERRYSMRVWLDRARMAAFNITAQDIEDALRAQNLTVPAGRIESNQREFTVESRTNLATPEQFSQVILRQDGTYLVRLGDVAKVELGPENERILARYNSRESVTVAIVKQATANPLDIAAELRNRLPEIRTALPAGYEIEISYDSSIFIDRSIQAVYHTVAEAVVLVVIVIFLFLRSGRATLIPLVTIPVSLVGACAIMFALGFTLNTVTLLAFVLAIGLVVDDAIVVLENIYRHVENGMRPREAAMLGVREIAFAVVAMTLTLAAVYAPVAFAEGRIGRLFAEFALTLAGAVLVSGFIALTLTPMMCAQLLHHGENHGRFYRAIEAVLDRLDRLYAGALDGALRRWPVVVVAGLAVGIANWFLFTGLKSELAPVEDRGTINIRGTAPEGATLDFTGRYGAIVEKLGADLPEVAGILFIVGSPDVTTVTASLVLRNWEERDRAQQAITAEIQPKLARVPGINIFASNPPSLGQSGREKTVQFVIQSSGSFDELDQAAQKLIAAIAGNPGLVNVESDLTLNKPQLEVAIDREKAASLGIDAAVIARTLETFFGGRNVTKFERNDKQYDVVVQVADSDMRQPSDLTSLYVRAASGEMVQVSSLARVTERVGPKELLRFNKARSATIGANLAPGYSLGEALQAMEAAARETLPPGYRYDYAGQSREFREASGSLYVTFLLAVAFIFLVLAAQFESFVAPVVILLSVPLSIAGALAALLLSGGTLNVYSQIGLITLVGLISKHGILIVEFANQLLEQGRSRRDAVIEAARLRLRPILMTTGAMVLGAVPLALATGPGAESRQDIGWVIVGGMSFGTLLTLFVVPTVYLLANRRGRGAPADIALPVATDRG